MYILQDKRFIHIDCVQCAGWRGGGNKQMTCIRFCCGIPLPTLDSKISRNHVAGAFYDFLLEYHPSCAGGTRSPPAMLNRLKNPKWPLGGPKLANGVYPYVNGQSGQLLQISFLTHALLLREKLTREENKLGLSCAKLSLASAKLHTSLSSDQLKLATN